MKPNSTRLKHNSIVSTNTYSSMYGTQRGYGSELIPVGLCNNAKHNRKKQEFQEVNAKTFDITVLVVGLLAEDSVVITLDT